MPLVRFSAAEYRSGEQRGLVLPSPEMAVHTGELALYAARCGIRPARCESNALVDLTPSYATANKFRYILETGPEDPPESGVVHLMPNEEGTDAVTLGAGGMVLQRGIRHMRIPEDNPAFAWVAPTGNAAEIKLVELVSPLREEAVIALDALAQHYAQD